MSSSPLPGAAAKGATRKTPSSHVDANRRTQTTGRQKGREKKNIGAAQKGGLSQLVVPAARGMCALLWLPWLAPRGAAPCACLERGVL